MSLELDFVLITIVKW